MQLPKSFDLHLDNLRLHQLLLLPQRCECVGTHLFLALVFSLLSPLSIQLVLRQPKNDAWERNMVIHSTDVYLYLLAQLGELGKCLQTYANRY